MKRTMRNIRWTARKSWRAGLLGSALAASVTSGCGEPPTSESGVGRVQQAVVTNPLESSCGYELGHGTYTIWPGGYQAWVDVKNVSGETATDFEVFVDVGDTTISNGYLAEYEQAEDGYSVTAPSWLQYQKIPQGSKYQFQFNGSGNYQGLTGYIISVNGVTCDQVAPEISLSASSELFTEPDTLTLTADATDNVAVRKVVFEQDGEVIGEDAEAPFTFDVDVSEALNGRHLYTATAYDPTGNQATSEPVRVLVAIDNKFFGTAPGGPQDYTHLLDYFDQLTPGNAGKWGSVESVRDVMNWTDLDTAHAFAADNGLRFKYHTLIWGQQQPSWIDGLSSAEQLEEIEEWFAAVAQRYPDLEMIDVVNEPLHAPPSYAEALGGAGETGWDWVIHSFELARQYFPNSQLILNDYQVLILEQFTNDYLELVDLLNERGLIDGIGLQAHFLERAEVPVVAANLETLAATGLPIYISEFDVNFADDARQANVVRDLFTLFWDNPAVVGVTHWGHQQGSMFRPDAYLVRADGSTRPALDWLTCYIGGGSECTVPEYVPAPRLGDSTGITLEAEDYDAAEGLIAAGDAVAYTDDGDWQSFAKVSLQDDWDTFSVNYAKGNEGPSSITVHVGSLDNDPAVSVDLPSTGSYGTYQTVSVPWAPLSGEQDIFIRYNGGYGVANVDSFYFGPPKGQGLNLVDNSDFESNAEGWFSWNGTLATTTARAHSGFQSLVVTGRSGNGPAATSLTSAVAANTTYQTSFWVSIGGAPSANVNLTTKIQCGDTADYLPLTGSVTVNDGEWVQLTGSFTVPDCELTDLLVYAEGPPGGVDLYVDDVSVLAPLGGNLLSDGDFESGIGSWFSWDGTLMTTTALVHGGSQSLVVSGRSGNGPAARNVTSLVDPATSHQVTFWVSVSGDEAANVNTTSKIVCDGEDATYSWIASPQAVAPGEWVELSAPLDLPDCALSEVLIYAEGPPGGVDVYVDDVVLSP